MSSQPFHAEPLESMVDGAATAPSHPRMVSLRHELPLFQFGLRQLFWVVTAVCALLAAMASSGGVPALVLVMAILVVVMHVSSTALGSWLRAQADEARQWELRELELRAHTEIRPPAHPQAAGLPPCSPLHERRAAHRRLLPVVSAGIVLGAITGGVLLSATIGNDTSSAGIAVGSISTAVLGGWIAFLGGNFYSIARHVWREAVAQERRDEARRNNRR